MWQPQTVFPTEPGVYKTRRPNDEKMWLAPNHETWYSYWDGTHWHGSCNTPERAKIYSEYSSTPWECRSFGEVLEWKENNILKPRVTILFPTFLYQPKIHDGYGDLRPFASLIITPWTGRDGK